MHRFSVFAAAIVVAAVLQSPAVQAQASQAPSFTAGWNDGFFVQSANGEYRLQIGMLLQTDQRWAIDDPENNIIDTFTFRRIRPILQGRVAKHFDFSFNPDFAGALVNIRDAYVDTRFSTAFRIRVGKGKTPFGLERLHGAASLTFVERSLPTAVAPDRDVGVQVLGDISGGLVSYDHAAVGEGTRNRLSPQWFYYYKGVGAFGEYTRYSMAFPPARVTRRTLISRELRSVFDHDSME